MTDTQMLNSILEAYTNWQEMIGQIPEASDCLDMTDEQYDHMIDCYDKEIAKLKHEFLKLMDEAVDRAWRNATFDEDAAHAG